MSRSFESLAAFAPWSVNLSGVGDPQRLEIVSVTAHFFEALGIHPLLGRTFRAAGNDEDRSGAVLSHGTWQSDFGGDPAVIGRKILLDSRPFMVIGVMPAEFLFPNRGVCLWTLTEFKADDFAERNNYYISILGRLKEGVAFDQAAAELRVIGGHLERQYLAEDKNSNIFLSHVQDEALLHLSGVPLGFQTEHRLFFKTNLPLPKYLATNARERYYDQILSGLRALPGVSSAAAISFRPLGSFQGGNWPIQSHGETKTDRFACVRFVTPGYFSTMNIPMLRGRDINRSDRLDSLPVAVVSESFVKTHWPGESGIGKTFKIPFGGLQYTVAGVCGDVRFRGPEIAAEPQFYAASAQMPDEAFVHFYPKDFVIATSLADPLALAPAVRRLVKQADPLQPVSEIQTLSALVEGEVSSRRIQLWVVAIFAGAALLLAGVGIHGLLAFTVGRRVPEIGLRCALGADHGQIISLVFGEALILALIGSAVGIMAAYVANRSIRAFLVGVSPSDGWSFVAAAVTMVGVGVAGPFGPLLQALRVDPSQALRAE